MDFPNPELLTHPNIPKPLHGVNPRSIMGKEWWDEKRKEAYATNFFCCWACGTHKSKAAFHNWLEGHENYDINYETGEVRLNGIVALCHSCHNFIHSGRLYMMYQSGEYSKAKCLTILNHGFSILAGNGLTPFWGTVDVWNLLTGDNMPAKYDDPDEQFAEWGDWHLVIDGEKHYSKFENIQEWAEFYLEKEKT
jgi:hypothetical protein